MQYKNLHKTYGISEIDFRILAYLNKFENVVNMNNLSATTISNNLKIARTTILFRLKELEKRNLVQSNKVSKNRIFNITEIAKNILIGSQKEEMKIESVFGLDNLLNLFETILNNKSEERIYGIEPALQVEKYNNKITASEQKKFKIKITELFKQKEHISEGITGESAIKTIQNLDKEILISMWGRMTIATLVPDHFINFKDYIIVFNGKTYFLDFINETGIIVNDKNFSDSMISIIKTLQKLGKVINLNEEIKKVLLNKYNYKIS